MLLRQNTSNKIEQNWDEVFNLSFKRSSALTDTEEREFIEEERSFFQDEEIQKNIFNNFSEEKGKDKDDSTTLDNVLSRLDLIYSSIHKLDIKLNILYDKIHSLNNIEHFNTEVEKKVKFDLTEDNSGTVDDTDDISQWQILPPSSLVPQTASVDPIQTEEPQQQQQEWEQQKESETSPTSSTEDETEIERETEGETERESEREAEGKAEGEESHKKDVKEQSFVPFYNDQKYIFEENYTKLKAGKLELLIAIGGDSDNLKIYPFGNSECNVKCDRLFHPFSILNEEKVELGTIYLQFVLKDGIYKLITKNGLYENSDGQENNIKDLNRPFYIKCDKCQIS